MKETGENEWIKKFLKNKSDKDESEKDDYNDESEDAFDDTSDHSTDATDHKDLHNVKAQICEGRGLADVAGMEWLKTKVMEDFVNVIKYPIQAGIYHVKPANMLFYGPPGCGKTYFAKKLAEEVGINFMSVVPDELGSTYIHGSQQKIRAMFEDAERKAPTIIFLDEIDALVPDRDTDESNHQANETNEFLVLLNESVQKGVYVIGATNKMSRIESAVLRPGRFDECVYIGLPDMASRESMFKYHLSNLPIAGDIDYTKLAKDTEGFSCSDIDHVVRRASKMIFNKSIIKMEQTGECESCFITQEVIENMIKTQHPSVSASDMVEYEKMRDKHGFGKSPADTRRSIGFAMH